MNNEIKLKDMIDFLENIYKDIKKQPTLEEELEKERKFINKIKGDNKDEIKEILENVFDLAIAECPSRDIEKIKKAEDYITNLQQLYDKTLTDLVHESHRRMELEQENERLKEENKRIFSKVNDDELLISNAMNYAEAQDYKSRCEKAREELTYMSTDAYTDDYDIREKHYNLFMNILDGDDKSAYR